MECNPSSSTSRVDRRTIEKNRRIQMKALYSKLHSLVPHESSRDIISLPDQLQEAANYIKKLQIKLERMKEEKDNLMRMKNLKINPNKNITASSLMVGQQRTPQIDVREIGSSLEAILITGVDFQFLFSETIRVIHEEGFDVVNANFSIINDMVVHTIHAQIFFKCPKIEQAQKNATLCQIRTHTFKRIGETYASDNGVSRIIEKLNN
ncbi:hypothetical protein M8C21_017398, partial [Ambrosia artemisiifolia]